jgi:hypothetical protein
VPGTCFHYLQVCAVNRLRIHTSIGTVLYFSALSLSLSLSREAVGQQKFLRIHGSGTHRVVWSGADPKCIALFCGSQVLVCDIHSLRTASAMPDRGGSENFPTFSGGGAGTVCSGHTGQVVDGSFTPQGDALVTSCTDGTVKIWDTGFTMVAGRPGADLGWPAHARCVRSFQPFGGSPALSCIGISSNGKGVTHLLLGGGGNPASLTLWKAPQEDTMSLALDCIQTVTLPADVSMVLAANPSRTFVLAASEHALYVLHLSGNSSSWTIDYVRPFSIAHKVVSMAALDSISDSSSGFYEASEEVPPELAVYVVQSKPVQIYHIPTNEAYPGAQAAGGETSREEGSMPPSEGAFAGLLTPGALESDSRRSSAVEVGVSSAVAEVIVSAGQAAVETGASSAPVPAPAARDLGVPVDVMSLFSMPGQASRDSASPPRMAPPPGVRANHAAALSLQNVLMGGGPGGSDAEEAVPSPSRTRDVAPAQPPAQRRVSISSPPGREAPVVSQPVTTAPEPSPEPTVIVPASAPVPSAYVESPAHVPDAAPALDMAQIQSALQAALVPAVARVAAHTIERVLKPSLDETVQAAQRGAAEGSKSAGETNTQAVRAELKRAVAEAFASDVIPALQSAVSRMFGQMNSTLQAGLSASPLLNNSAPKLASDVAAVKGDIAALSSTLSSLQASVEGLRQDMSILPRNSAVAQLQTSLDGLRQDVARLPTATAAVPVVPHLVPPVPHPAPPSGLDPLQDLHPLLLAGKFNEALDKALSAQNTQVVLWVCHRVDPAVVSTSLSQPVLLCLLQQLGIDLEVDTPLKLAWLSHCSVALDPRNSLISPHCGGILRQLKERLEGITTLAQRLGGVSAMQHRTLVYVINGLLAPVV